MLTGYYQKKNKKQSHSSKKAREKYQNFSEKGKNKKRQYAWQRYKTLSEDGKKTKITKMVV